MTEWVPHCQAKQLLAIFPSNNLDTNVLRSTSLTVLLALLLSDVIFKLGCAF